MDPRERKVRELFDLVESFNFKAALKNSTKRDIAGIPVVKALRAYSLERLGRRQDALQLCAEIQSGGVALDDQTVHVLTSLFDFIGDRRQSLQLHQNACTHSPNDIDLQLGLFFEQIKNELFSDASITARTLYKLTSAPKFLHWTAITIILQNAPTALRLAEMMSQKALTTPDPMAAVIKGDKASTVCTDAECLGLFIDVLRRQGKFDEALSFVRDEDGMVPKAVIAGEAQLQELQEAAAKEAAGDGADADNGGTQTASKAIQPVDALREEAQLLVQAERYGEACVAFHRLLQEYDSDDWDYWTGLIYAFEHCAAEATADQLEGFLDASTALALQPADSVADLSDVAASELMTASGLCTVINNACVTHPKKRGPWLARAVVAGRFAQMQIRAGRSADSALEAFQARIVEYMERWGRKTCCFDDLSAFMRPFVKGAAPLDPAPLPVVTISTAFAPTTIRNRTGSAPDLRRNLSFVVSAAQRDSFVEALKAGLATVTPSDASMDSIRAIAVRFGEAKKVYDEAQRAIPKGPVGTDEDTSEPVLLSPEDSKTLLQAQEQLHRCVLHYQMLRHVGEQLIVDDASLQRAVAEASGIMELWRNTLDFNTGASGGQREVQHGDGLVLIAAQILRDAGHWALRAGRDQQAKELWVQAAVALEEGNAQSPYNFQFSLHLMEIYAFLGAVTNVLDQHEQLGIKQVQLDSMSYLTLPHLVHFGQEQAGRDLCDDIFRMHNGSERDTPRYIRLAFDEGNYSRVLDMIRFTDRMKRSMQQADARTLAAILSIPMRSLGETTNWLQGVVLEGEFKACWSPLSPQEMTDLCDNCDYDVLAEYAHPDIQVVHDAHPTPSRRLTATQAAVQVRQSLMRTLLYALRTDLSAFNRGCDEVMELLTTNGWLGGAAPGAADGVVATLPLDAPGLAKAHVGFSSQAWRTVASAMQLCRSVLSLKDKPANSDDWADAEPSIDAALSAVAELQMGVCTRLDAAIHASQVPPTEEGAKPKLGFVAPAPLGEAATALIETFTLVPVFIAAATQCLPRVPKAKGKKGKASAAAQAPTSKAMGVSIKLKQLIQHVTDAMRSFTERVDPIKRQPAGTSAAWAGLHAADAANAEASTIRVDALWSETASCVQARRAVFDNLRSSQKNIASAITSNVQDRCTFLRSLKI